MTVELPDGDDEEAIRAEAARRRIALETMRELPDRPGDAGPPTLLLGYARLPEAAIGPGVRELAEAVRAVAPA